MQKYSLKEMAQILAPKEEKTLEVTGLTYGIGYSPDYYRDEMDLSSPIRVNGDSHQQLIFNISVNFRSGYDVNVIPTLTAQFGPLTSDLLRLPQLLGEDNTKTYNAQFIFDIPKGTQAFEAAQLNIKRDGYEWGLIDTLKVTSAVLKIMDKTTLTLNSAAECLTVIADYIRNNKLGG